jgi:hypothetical protein
MKHNLEDYTDADLSAAIASDTVPEAHKIEMYREQTRRDWDLVGGAFDEGMQECHACGYWFYQYWTDTGAEQTCDLLDRDGGEPWQCPAYDRLKEENEDEAPK